MYLTENNKTKNIKKKKNEYIKILTIFCYRKKKWSKKEKSLPN